MDKNKPLTRRRTRTPSVATENVAFFREKVKPLFPKFTGFYEALGTQFPELCSTPAQLYRWQNIHSLKVAAKTDEIVALRTLVKDELQRQINTI